MDASPSFMAARKARAGGGFACRGLRRAPAEDAHPAQAASRPLRRLLPQRAPSGQEKHRTTRTLVCGAVLKARLDMRPSPAQPCPRNLFAGSSGESGSRESGARAEGSLRDHAVDDDAHRLLADGNATLDRALQVARGRHEVARVAHARLHDHLGDVVEGAHAHAHGA